VSREGFRHVVHCFSSGREGTSTLPAWYGEDAMAIVAGEESGDSLRMSATHPM